MASHLYNLATGAPEDLRIKRTSKAKTKKNIKSQVPENTYTTGMSFHSMVLREAWLNYLRFMCWKAAVH